jgi:hypothetical protein
MATNYIDLNKLKRFMGYLYKRFLPLSGGTLTGNLILNQDPTIPKQAATKNYVDTNITNLNSTLGSAFDKRSGDYLLISANTVLASAQSGLRINANTAAILITLPTASVGLHYNIFNSSIGTISISTSAIFIGPYGNSSTSLIIPSGIVIDIYSDGTNWIVFMYSGMMVGATGSTAGTIGLPPATLAGDNSKMLLGNATWGNLPPRTDNITNTTDDTTTNWCNKGPGNWFYSVAGQLNNQPSQYGHLLNLTNGGTEVSQLFIVSGSANIYVRGGNSSGWMQEFTRLALLTDGSSTSVSAGTLSIGQSGSYVWSATGTIPLPDGYTRSQCKYAVWMWDWMFYANGGSAHAYMHVDQSTGVVTIGKTDNNSDASFGNTAVGYLCVGTK